MAAKKSPLAATASAQQSAPKATAKKSRRTVELAPAQKPASQKAAAKPVRKAARKLASKLLTKAVKTSREAAGNVRRKLGKAKAVKRLAPAATGELAARLAVAIPKPVHELAFRSPFELLIATILAAQSTDRTVNQVMPTLLARYPSARELARATQEDVETLVKRTGFFRNKARSIRETSQQLVAEFAGEVPQTMDQITKLKGVARKTGNVVLGTAYGIQAGFIVDTHVSRVALRVGLTRQTDPMRIEADLCRAFEQPTWTDLGHRFTLHGRYTCLAKSPLCSDCPINELCSSRESEPADVWEQRAAREGARVSAGIRSSQAG